MELLAASWKRLHDVIKGLHHRAAHALEVSRQVIDAGTYADCEQLRLKLVCANRSNTCSRSAPAESAELVQPSLATVPCERRKLRLRLGAGRQTPNTHRTIADPERVPARSLSSGGRFDHDFRSLTTRRRLLPANGEACGGREH